VVVQGLFFQLLLVHIQLGVKQRGGKLMEIS
jgi:hypothetical protein